MNECYPQITKICCKGKRGDRGDVGPQGKPGPRGDKGCRGDSCGRGGAYTPVTFSLINALISSYPQIHYIQSGQSLMITLPPLIVQVAAPVPFIALQFTIPKDFTLDTTKEVSVTGNGIDFTTYENLILSLGAWNDTVTIQINFVSNSGPVIPPGSYNLYGVINCILIQPECNFVPTLCVCTPTH